MTWVLIGGKKYKLQHPGNRSVLRMMGDVTRTKNGGATIDLEKVFDYCFEHVVFPAEGPKISLDTVSPKEVREWQAVLLPFLNGDPSDLDEWRTDPPAEPVIA